MHTKTPKIKEKDENFFVYNFNDLFSNMNLIDYTYSN